jgi:hypothetical protein
LIRVVENTTGDTWRNIRNELDRLHLVILATAEGYVAQRSQLTTGQKKILTALDVPEPPKRSPNRPSSTTSPPANRRARSAPPCRSGGVV